MIPQDTCGPGAVALRDSSEIFLHRGLVSFVVRSNEHHTGDSAVDPTDPIALTDASLPCEAAPEGLFDPR